MIFMKWGGPRASTMHAWRPPAAASPSPPSQMMYHACSMRATRKRRGTPRKTGREEDRRREGGEDFIGAFSFLHDDAMRAIVIERARAVHLQ